MEKEINLLAFNKTWEVVDLPSGKKAYWLQMGLQDKA